MAWLPLVALAPVQPPEAVQLETLALFQVRVAPVPLVTFAGLAASVTVGVGGAVTLTVVVAAVVPPAPLQVRVKLVVAVRAPVLLMPVQPPDAEQSSASVVSQPSVAAVPATIAAGAASRLTTGAKGLAALPPPPPPQAEMEKARKPIAAGRHNMAASLAWCGGPMNRQTGIPLTRAHSHAPAAGK